MATSTHNGAVNFHSYIESGVDLRTGTFSTNLLLGTLIEPNFEVRLCYSPLNQKDFGFGHGWRIPVTIYSTKSKLLSLSDGRMYEVEEDGSTLTLKDNTGDIHAVKVTQPEGIKITYRDTGAVEWLFKKSHWYACTARTSTSGDALYFKWHVEEGASPKIMLREIFKSTTAFDTVDDIDVAKTIMLSIHMEASKISIVFWPAKDEQRSFSLTLDKNQLTHINNTSFTPALRWEFGYDENLSPNRLNMITSPLGKREHVIYSASKALVKDEPARIAKHNTFIADAHMEGDMTESPFWTVDYSYHLKPGGLLCIKTRGTRNGSENVSLECFATLYEGKHLLEMSNIEFIETSQDAINRDHLLDKSIRNLPGILKRTDTVYSYSHYMLPREKLIDIRSIDTKQDPRIFTKRYDWDQYGRLIKKIDDDQTTDQYVYLDQDGTESSLVSWHIHTDIDSEITDRYTYGHFIGTASALQSIPKRQSNLLKSMTRQILLNTGLWRFEKSTSEYFDTPGKFFHGKLKQHQTFRQDGYKQNDNTTPTQTTNFRYNLEGEKQGIESTITGFDGSVTTVESVKSIYTGLTVREKDIDGNISDYSWDPLSRLTGIINNSATPYKTEETFTHGIIDSDNTYEKVLGYEEPIACFKGYVIHQDSVGRKLLTGHDPHSQEVQTWIFNKAEYTIEGLDEWLLAEEKGYDSAGRIIQHALIRDADLATSSVEYNTVYVTPYSYWTYHERTHDEYDITHTLISESDQICITTYIDSENLRDPDSDPTLLKPLENLFDTTKANSTASYEIDESGLLKSYAIPNLALNPGKNQCWSRLERVDARGNVIEKHIYTMNAKAEEGKGFSTTLIPALHSSKTYSYNQKNAVTSFKDDYNNSTTFLRDVHNRPSIITRSDGSKLKYEYAEHSDKSLITHLSASHDGITVSLGTQAFDGLERLKESNSGGGIQKFEYSGALQAPAKILKPDGKYLQYDVIREFGDVIKSIKAESIEHNFEYFSDSGLLKEYSDQSGYKSTLTYDSQIKVIEENIISATGQPNKKLCKSFSPTGGYTAFTDAATKQQISTYTKGKIATAEDSDIKIVNEYGAFDKIIKQTSTNKSTQKTLITDYAYDILGNETSRTITTSGKKDKLVISQTLRKNNQLATRMVMDGKKTLRNETFSYSSVDMLIDYTCTGDDLPLDGYGKPISRLELTYDLAANLTQCVTHFGDAKDTATFIYENAKDPCQLTRVTHTHEDYQKLIELSYDANGCMTKNEKSQTLTYDALNRLASLKDGADTYHYHYDPKGKLTSRTKLKIRSEWYYQPGGEYPLLSNQVIGDVHTRITRMAEQVTAIVTGADGSAASTVKLVGIDRMNSPVIVLEGDGSRSTQKYSPSGHSNSALVVGQSGELYDDVGGFFHLGERQYSPRLFRFTTPDSWSPFGEAGPNCYTYLDPVNCRDPEGHLSGWAWFGIAMGVLTIVLGVLTLGASIAAVAAFGATLATAFTIVGAISTIASGAVGIAAAAISESNPALSAKLEWVSFGLFSVGMVFTLGAGFAPGAGRMAMRGARAGAPRMGRAARYAVQSRVAESLEMKLITPVASRSGVAMEMKFAGGSRYAFSTASSMTSGIQTSMSSAFIETLARIAEQPAVRVVGTTMGMMALLGLVIAAKQYA
ncbi:RHS repeat domain-containing protein [Pseudomonas sp. W5-36]|uniref:RHS repeat domain-containing protein n=1 Tax=Pseudomonas sp. W5-36 TaxID=3097455 RepID=UPI00397D43C6